MPENNRQSPRSFAGEVKQKVNIDYLLYLPPDYNSDNTKKWPLVFFLHGAGERGADLNFLKRHGLPKLVENGQDFPFIIVSPQCPENERWVEHIATLDGLFEEILSKYRVATDRIYLTGLSMGGFGAWRWISVHPNRFAAVVPICGGGNPLKAALIKDVPLWVFHGANDQIVPLSASEEMVKALREQGSNVKFTVYPGVDHDSWTQTYANPQLYEWLLQHTLAHS